MQRILKKEAYANDLDEPEHLVAVYRGGTGVDREPELALVAEHRFGLRGGAEAFNHPGRMTKLPDPHSETDRAALLAFRPGWRSE